MKAVAWKGDGFFISLCAVYAFLRFSFWNRIMPVRTPGVTFGNAFHAQPYSFKRPPYFNGFNGILAAGRFMPAIFTQQGRKRPLVKFYRENKYVVNVLQDYIIP